MAGTWGDRIQRAGTGRQPAPMNAPPAQPLGIGVQPGTPNVIRARLVEIFGTAPPPSSGLFVYDASGRLVAAIAGAPGTDPIDGTAVPEGVSANDGTVTVDLVGRQIVWNAFTADNDVSPPSLTSTPSDVNGSFLIVHSGQGVGGANEASMDFEDSTFAATTGLVPSGIAAIVVPTTCFIVTDSWHGMPAMSNGWGIGGHATYRLTPFGDLQVSFKDLTTGTDTDGTAIWAAGSLPAAYRPANNRRVVCYTDQTRVAGTTTGMAALEFETDGSVQCYAIAGAASRADLFATIPLTS